MMIFIGLIVLLLFFAVVLMLGFIMGVTALNSVTKMQDGSSEKGPHGDNWDDCPDCRH